MANEKNVRYPEWIQNAVKIFQKDNNIPSFSKAVIFLVECELNRRGYFRADYEPNISDHEITYDIRNPNETPSEKEKKLEAEAELCRLQLERIKKTTVAGKTVEEILQNEQEIKGFIFSAIRREGWECINRLPKDQFLSLAKIAEDFLAKNQEHPVSKNDTQEGEKKSV